MDYKWLAPGASKTSTHKECVGGEGVGEGV